MTFLFSIDQKLSLLSAKIRQASRVSLLEVLQRLSLILTSGIPLSHIQNFRCPSATTANGVVSFGAKFAHSANGVIQPQQSNNTIKYPYFNERISLPESFNGCRVEAAINECLGVQEDRVKLGEIVAQTFESDEYGGNLVVDASDCKFETRFCCPFVTIRE